MKLAHVSMTLRAYVKGSPLLYESAIPLVRWTRDRVQCTRDAFYKRQYHIVSKKEFVNDIGTAVQTRTGYAAGKIGYSEQHWMYYEILMGKEKDINKLKEFEGNLSFHGLKQEGVFPAKPDFYLEFNKFYIPHVKNIDCLGICYRPWEQEIFKYHQLKNKKVHYPHQQTINYDPTEERSCYLPYFKDKKILIVCPFAEILKERATKEIYERVWSKTEKKSWFYPKSVDALEFPYGFAEETQRQYSTVIDLLEYITDEIDKREFDIALIGAGGLAIPLASYVKSKGKIGIDLGGHLQVIFGVLGERWRNFESWKKYYINEWWIDMPARYRPKKTDVCDNGAYW